MSTRERSVDRGGKRFLRMDRNYPPIKINDPSLPTGRRKEIDNVMKKARNNPNDYWDKKLLEVEERDPNRWRHTGYKKLYVEGEKISRSRSRSPSRGRRPSPPHPMKYRGSPPVRDPRQRSPPLLKRPKSPQEAYMRRKPMPPGPRRKPLSPPPKPRPPYRPPSPPHSKRSPSVSSSSSSSSSESYVGRRSRSRSPPPPKRRILSPPPHPKQMRYAEPCGSKVPPSTRYARSPSPPVYEEYRKLPEKRYAEKVPIIEKPVRPHKARVPVAAHKHISPKPRVTSTSDEHPLKTKPRPQEPIEPPPKPKKSKRVKEKHAPVRIKIEDEPKRRTRSSSSESNCSSGSDVCVFNALNASTKISLSERFGKIAQWSMDRTNMENMRITKNSAGGDLKVLIEEGIESPSNPRRGYSPVRPAGHFPDELLTEGPTAGLLTGSWDDVRVRYQYYKDRGYLRGLDLQDYIKWEEWWYRYQEWLRNCEMWERSQMPRRPRKKIPITARLN